jgi:hypothetical protein
LLVTEIIIVIPKKSIGFFTRNALKFSITDCLIPENLSAITYINEPLLLDDIKADLSGKSALLTRQISRQHSGLYPRFKKNHIYYYMASSLLCIYM